MTISKKEWTKEENRLEMVLEKVEEKLAEGRESEDKFAQEVRDSNKKMWNAAIRIIPEDSSETDPLVEANQYLLEQNRQIRTYEFYQRIVGALEEMRKSPYFGRIDFLEDGEAEAEQIYIGISTLMDEDTGELYVYDWRAPISSMFYDYQPGPAKYNCKVGEISGNIELKRQYKIEDGEIEYMFDTDIKIDDQILQDILGKSKSGKMKNIVTTIQQEQNKVIRDDDHKVMILAGCPGSGKTSIVMHRIAYLLYKYRETINSENILVISPNDIFSDYISDVLPGLGESNMSQLTFNEYAKKFLNDGLEIEDMNTQLEYFLSKDKETDEYQARVSGTRYKTSEDFVQVLDNYINLLEKEGLNFETLEYRGQTIVTKDELKELWQKQYSYAPFMKRLNRIHKKLISNLKEIKRERIDEVSIENAGFMWDSIKIVREETKYLKKKINEMTSFDAYRLYYKLFEDEELFARVAEGTQLPEDFEEIRELALESYRDGTILYEDVAPLLYFKKALTLASPVPKGIKYVMVDEAQDYSPLHYKILKQLFNESNLTVVGDLNQAIHPYMGIGTYQNIAEIFDTDSVKEITLKKSYRSTSDIIEFAKGVLPASEDIEVVDRPGDKVEKIQVDSDQLVATIEEEIEYLQEKNAESIAIICKTEAESKRVYDKLKDEVDIHLLTKEDFRFVSDVVILPSYLAKGLEFDGVLAHTSPQANYNDEIEKKLFYTVCTRALHYLKVIKEV